MSTNRHPFNAPLRLCVSLLLTFALAACAESGPYRRLETGQTQELTTGQLVEAFNNRWPAQFKCVQTVTIDFGPVTKTFNALLIIQRPGKFRLQGMTEQGIKIFELAHNENGDHVIFRADEMNERTIASISRDIRRVFLQPLEGVASASSSRDYHIVEGNSVERTSRVLLKGGRGSTRQGAQPQWRVVETRDAWVDRFEQADGHGRTYCYGYFEWQYPKTPEDETRGLFYPSVIVLRDSGRESKSYPYKLTIKISELTLRDTPWPEKTFQP